MKNVIIIILAILVLGLGGYLVYDKVIDKDVKEEVKEESSRQEKEEYTLIDRENESIQFLYSYRSIDSYMDKKLYTTEILKVEDRTAEEKYSMASKIFAKESHDGFNEAGQTIELLENQKVKNAYERIFGPNTYKKPQSMSSGCSEYKVYSKDNNYYIVEELGCGGPVPVIVENIDEVRKYEDRIEIRTSFCTQGIIEELATDENMKYHFYYKDLDEKELIAKVAKNSNVDIFKEYKDKMNHMTYTYNLGEDGFYYYYSSQLDK